MVERWDPLADPLTPHLSIDGDGWTVGDDTGPQPRVRCRRTFPLVWVGVLLIWAVLLVAAMFAAPAAGDTLTPIIRAVDRACRCGWRPPLEETP